MSTPARPKFCIECGGGLPEVARFCPQCGTKVPVADTSPPAEPLATTPPLPPDLRAKFENARQELRGERREVVVLFADVSGYTAMSEGLDPEEVSLIMQGLMRELADCVYRYEGYVDKYIGDAIMALFGAPVAHEDDPERALLAGLDMLRVTARRREEGSPIHLRVGLNIGDVVAAHMGSEMRLQYTVMGDAVNVASRLEGKAELDSILISHALQERVAATFETEEVPPLTVKGKSEPLRAHRVIRYRPAPLGLDHVVTPFVGRDTELASLESYFQSIVSGEPSLLLLEAEAGAGKSRLLREAIARTRVGLFKLEAEFSPFLLPGAMPLPSTIFRQLLEGESGTSREAADRLFETLGADAEANRSGFESLLETIGPDGPDTGRDEPPVNPQIERQNRWAGLSALLREISRGRPILLVLEDVHFASESDDEFLAFLVPVLAGHRIGIVATGRPGASRSWIPADAQRLLLRQLGTQDVRSFLGDLFDGLRPSVRKELLRRSQGNPLYLEELARSMRESMEVAVTTVPGTLQGLLQSRIDHLAPSMQLLVQMAAVLGTEFHTGLLSHMYRLEDQAVDFEQALRALGEGGFVEAGDKAERYRFRHALMQEVAYGRLLVRVRKILHESAARLGEEFYADRLDAEAPFFAHHYWEADLRTDAAPHLWKAGEAAARAYELVQAELHYERLAKVMEEEPSLLADPDERARMAESYGYVLFDRGRLEEAEVWFGVLERLGESCDRPDWTVRSLWYQGLNAINRGELDRAESLLERGLSLVSDADDRLKADLHSALGLVHHDRADADASLRHHEEALGLRSEIGDPLGKAKSLMNMGNVYFNLRRDYERAEEHYERALEFSQKAGDRLMRGGCTLNLGSLAMDRGDWQPALRRFQRVNAVAEEMGWSFLRFLSMRNQAECLLNLGQIDKALNLLETCRTQGDDVLIPVNRVAIRLLSFEAYMSALAEGPAVEALEAAQETASRFGVTEIADWLRGSQGRRLAMEAKWEESANSFAEASKLATGLQNLDFAQLYLAHERRARARAGLDDREQNPELSTAGRPVAARILYLSSDGRASVSPSPEVARELEEAGQAAARLEYVALERATFERQAEVWAELGETVLQEQALARAAAAMRKLAAGLPVKLREAFLAHPRNEVLRAVPVESLTEAGGRPSPSSENATPAVSSGAS